MLSESSCFHENKAIDNGSAVRNGEIFPLAEAGFCRILPPLHRFSFNIPKRYRKNPKTTIFLYISAYTNPNPDSMKTILGLIGFFKEKTYLPPQPVVPFQQWVY
jgi:hypothetical protein